MACLLTLGALAPSAYAASLLDSNASVLAINTKDPLSRSAYPLGEGPETAIDQIPSTKYLNFAQPSEEVGLVVSPLFGGTVAQSIQFTTANDFEIRDPTGFILYGTNDSIVSVDNGTLEGGETWTQLHQDALDFPTGEGSRNLLLDPIPFSNTTAFNNYRIEFTGNREENNRTATQIADIQLFDDLGFGIFGLGDSAIAYQLPQAASDYPAAEGPQNIVDFAFTADSSYPAGENPNLLADGDTGTKYLNFGGANSGFIVTPDSAAQVQSFIVTSANDAIERHPTQYQIFGTNETIVSTDDSAGVGEMWTEISSGEIVVPGGLFTDSPVVSFANGDTYSSYKLLFPETNGSGIMQISEASFFESTDGTGTDILEVGTPDLLAIGAGTTKNFNSGADQSGYIITPAGGASTVDGFQVTTANDATERDPGTWELYGTNETIASEDNSQGLDEAWTLIETGTFTDDEVSLTREVAGDVVSVTNETEYTSYKFVFPTLRDTEAANGLQIADLQLFGEITTPGPNLGDFNGDGLVDAADYTLWSDNLGAADESALNGNGDGGGVTQSDYDLWVANYGRSYASAGNAVPEPTSLAVLLLGLLPAAYARNR